MNKQAFIERIAQIAVEEMKRTQIPASLTIAQAILESSWGESGLTQKANNLFGIKGTGPAGSVFMPTTEYVNGQKVKVNANFRAYNNWAESIADHSKLILNGTRDKPKRYHGVLGADYKTACHAIKEGGYATDPNYPQLLIDLIEKYNLQKYDIRPEPVEKKPVNVELLLPVQGYVIDGVSYLPIRTVADAVGAEVEWFPDTKQVRVNGKDISKTIENGVSYAPARELADILGLQAEWVEPSKTVKLK
ncbi:glucosaminidase domain-containing protein [Brevibacillus borstelensis]|uniref:glucosaminidase domain-containing protein n=1 Tax=Brevibacillus borstelensis TaxID=45462 RepID=UPI000A5CC9B0|nr:glucosaminidase domain-containing protein [Brevibacillus borstelensis]MED2006987.1 glucosaminidase domain-containing protein [Brevibacillus borstelensis]